MACQSAIVLSYLSSAGTYAILIFVFRNPFKRKHVMIWWCKVLQNRYTMADITPTSSTPTDPKKQSRALKGINHKNPNDEAFELVIMFVLFCVTTTHLFSFFQEHRNSTG
jgi:hypothetical protein